jgi:hypothetical protein
MGMGSPENRRKADGSYRAKASVGYILPAGRLQKRRRTVAGLPVSLTIGIWLVGAMWIVGLSAHYFGFSSDLVWFVLFLGTGVALLEWRAAQNRKDG